MHVRTLAPLAALLLVGCASVEQDREARFFSALTSAGEVRIAGWAHTRGVEFLIFPDHRSMRNLLADPPSLRDEAGWPQSTRCISAYRRHRQDGDRLAYDRKRVVVTGRLLDYAAIPQPREEEGFTDAVMWEGIAIQNHCFGKKVLILSSVKLAG